MGASDLTPPTEDAVDGLRGRRSATGAAFFTTADTVEDLEALRIALQRRQAHARRHLLRHVRRAALRTRVPANGSARLVLDCVVPADGVSLLSHVPIQATGACSAPETTKALAKVVARAGQRPGAARHAHRAVGRRAARRRLHRRDPARPRSGDDARSKALLAGVAQGRAPLDRQRAQPGPAREHAVRRLARALGRRVGAAEGPRGRRSTRAAAKLTRRRPLPVRPRDRDRRTASRCSACTGRRSTCRRRRARATSRTSRRCCSPATATSRRRWSGRSRRPTRAPRGRLIVVKGAGHGVQGQGDPAALAAVRRLVASPRVNATALDDLIRSRRTHKAFGPDPVAARVAARAVRARPLGAQPPPDRPVALPRARPERRASAQAGRRGRPSRARARKLDRAPTLIVASARQTGDAEQDHEDVLATAVASYIVLLGAHARGLAGYWRTVPVMEAPAGRAALGTARRRAADRAAASRRPAPGAARARPRAGRGDRDLPGLKPGSPSAWRPARSGTARSTFGLVNVPGQGLLGDRVQEHPLPPGPPRRRRAHRAPPRLPEGGQGGPQRRDRQGLRALQRRLRRADQGRDRGRRGRATRS